MESTRMDRASEPEMYQKPTTLSFLGRRSIIPRPLTQVTEFHDTDLEDHEDDTNSDHDSASTLSTLHELTTPRFTNDLTGYQFYVDNKSGRRSIDSQLHATEQTYEDNAEGHEVILALSSVPHTPKPEDWNKMSLNAHFPQNDEHLVRSWTPEEVADYMGRSGFDSSVIDKFLDNDINGNILLDLQVDDLKEIDIVSFGKRRQIMTCIQQLRDSTLISPRASGEYSQVSRAESTRRGRFDQSSVEDVVPAESVSIVAIEQVLPRPHHCTKGEDCSKWQRQQIKIAKIEEQLATDMKGLLTPSVVASSDVLGPGPSRSSAFAINPERLSTIEPRDPLENVRNFLSFQHVNSPTTTTPQPEPAQSPYTQTTNNLPKLTIPAINRMSADSVRTPASAFRNPTEYQAMLRAELQQDPYHYGGVASPVDVYRTGTPMSTTDIPVTAMPTDPCYREMSHSVPPEMRYGNTSQAVGPSISRSLSTQSARPNRRQPSFVPHMTSVREDSTVPESRPVISEAELVEQQGWMRKRKTTRLMRQEWQDNYCSLKGTKLGISKDELAKASESINVDEYTLHAYTTASSSKLSAAFKKGLRSSPTKPTFAFSLIPEDQKKSLFDKDKSHHFAVNSGTDRVEWMRKLMLAKAMKKNNGQI